MNVDPGEYVFLPGESHATYCLNNHQFTKFVLVDYNDNANTIQPRLSAINGISNFSPALRSGFLAFREYSTELSNYINTTQSLLHWMSTSGSYWSELKYIYRSVGDLAALCFEANIKLDLNHIFLVGHNYPRVKAIPITAQQDDLESFKTSLIRFYSNTNNSCQARVMAQTANPVNDPEFNNFMRRLNACTSIRGIKKSLDSFFFWGPSKRYCIISQFNEFVSMHGNKFDQKFSADQIYTWRGRMLSDPNLQSLVKSKHVRPNADEVDAFLLFIRKHVAHFTSNRGSTTFNDADALIRYLDQWHWPIMHQVYEAVEMIEDDGSFNFKFDFQSIDGYDGAN